MTTLSEKAAAFMAQNPTIIGVVGSVTYYEHPTAGDEAPLFFIEDGKLRESVYWDIESAQDAAPIRIKITGQWGLAGQTV